MHYTIYKITNLLDDKIYIGKHQTSDLNDDYMGSGKHLKRAIEKHGVKNFKKEILHDFDNEEEMNRKEAEMVSEEFVSRNDNYNLCVGGQGGFSHIRNTKNYKNNTSRGRQNADKILYEKYGVINSSQTIESRMKIKEHHKNGRYSYEHLNGTFKGKKHTAEAKRKIGEITSLAQSGSKNSQFGTMWITNEEVSKKIKKDEVIPEGWRKGRIAGIV